MTGSDLIVLVPWIVFGAGLATVILRLRRSRRSSQRPSPPRQPPRHPETDRPAEDPHPTRQAAGRGHHGART
jgi:hypothetical protein